jgi:hypothetical protein
LVVGRRAVSWYDRSSDSSRHSPVTELTTTTPMSVAQSTQLPSRVIAGGRAPSRVPAKVRVASSARRV